MPVPRRTTLVRVECSFAWLSDRWALAAIATNIKGLGANLITITPGAQSQGGVSLGNGRTVFSEALQTV